MKKIHVIIYTCLILTLHVNAQISCTSNANCLAVPNASVGCIANNCQILSCDPGFADCNGIYSDGCEVNLNALGITISANENTAIACSNSSITFNATPVNAGSSPSYQWKKNGVNVGTGTSAYTNNTWSNGDYVECAMIILTTCPPPATVWSNRIYVNLDNPTANTWQQKADLGFTQANGPTSRSGAVGFAIGNKGYIGTGNDPVNGYRKDLWEYDPATNSWTQRADFGGVGRELAVGFSIGNKGYIGTGYDGGALKNDFWEYDPISNTWVQKANFGGVARKGAVGFGIGNKGYIGTGEFSGNYADFWEYNPATNIWTQKANFSATARFWAVGFSIGNKGYIGTGTAFGNNFHKDFWEYDPTLNTWTQKADFGGSSRTRSIGYSIATKGYITSGIDATNWQNDCWEYDPTLNTWTQKANFGAAGREFAVGFSIGNKGYVGTGRTNSNNNYCQNDFWEYNPTTDNWLQKANFGGVVRYRAVGFNIGNKGYIGTGVNNVNNNLLKDFWEYNPDLNTWTQKADFGGTPRMGAVGFSIGDKGYLGTGDDNIFPPGASDFWEYNPSTNTWTQLADVGGFPRYDAVGFSIGNKGYIGTGIGYNLSTGQFFPNDFWEYDPAFNSWTQKANFSGGTRFEAVGFSIGNFGYIGTGQDNSGVYKNDFWEYSPATDIWTQRSNFGGTARCGAVGFSIGSKGYIGTGYGNGLKKDFWQYDATTNTWIQKADFGGIERGNACGFSIGNKGYLGFGYVPGGPNNDFWEYSPTNTRITTGSVNSILCPGNITVPYFIGCTAFNSGNVFTAQLSDSLGSFVNPLSIGTVNSTSSGNINVTIPANFQSGNKYRIRVIGSNPETIGTDNGQNISFSAPPIASISGATTGCGTVNLTATGGASYEWSGGNSTNTAANTFSVSNTYTVTVTDANGCAATSSISLTVNANPTVSVNGNNNICSGTSTTFSATGGTSYAWSNGDSTAATTVSAANTYTVTVTDVNGCTATNSISLTVNPNPTASVTGINSICSGASTTFSATGGTSYAWSNGDNTATTTVSAANTYTVTVTDVNGCTATNSISLTVNPNPGLSIVSTNAICAAANGTVSATANNGTAPYGFNWNNGQTTATLTGLIAGVYTLTITDANACFSTANTTVASDTGNIAATTVITNVTSNGGNDGTVNITLSGGTAPITYIWNTAATTEDLTGLTAGTYTVTISDANGCELVQNVNINQPPLGLTLTENNWTAKLFPNPTDNQTMVSVEMGIVANVQIRLVNSLGQVVQAIEYRDVSNIQHSLNVSALPPAVYMVEITAKGVQKVLRLVVTHK